MPASAAITRRLRKLVSMRPAEVTFRVRQQFQNRMEGLLLSLGVQPGTDGLLEEAPAKSQAKFFFSPAERSEIAGIIRTRLPREAEEIIARAERICAHRFDLLGYQDLDFGADIDWQVDPVHGKHAPLKPWYGIPYLDADVVGDSKIVWELNRHQHLVALGRAYQLTGRERYAEEFVRQFYHWRERNPYPMGINWTSALEVAFRSVSWLWARELFAGSPALTAEFHHDLLIALGVHGRYIERNLSRYFSRNTHLIGEAVALFFIGVLCPELKDAARWQALGTKTLLEEAQFQVRGDGGYFEQSTYYHVYALDFFLHARALAARNQISDLDALDHTIVAMLEYLSALAQGGPPPRWGDDDGGRLFDQPRNRSEHLLDPLSTGAVLCGRGDFKVLAGNLREETLWLLGPSAAEKFDKLVAAPGEGRSHAFAETGAYVLADPGLRLVMDAGPMGIARGGHGHADALAVTVTADGREWLEDRGTFAYTNSAEWRNAFRGTAAHNTLTIDGRDQSQPVGPFAWSDLTATQVERWVTGRHFDFVMASHGGYSPQRHRRAVFFVKPDFWLVADSIEGNGEHSLQLNWHAVTNCEMKDGAAVLGAGGQSFAIVPVNDAAWRTQIADSWTSPNYGARRPTEVVRCSAKLALPAHVATVLLPQAGKQVGTLERLPSDGSVIAYRYNTGHDQHLWVFSNAPDTWAVGEFSSDARVFYSRRNASGFTRAVLCDGSFAGVNGKTILSAERRCASIEWARSESGQELYCSEGVKVTADMEAGK